MSSFHPKRILVFRTAHLGDTVVALPALWSLREAYPDAHIALLSNRDAKNPHYISPDCVLPKEGLVDEFIAYPTNLGKAASVATMASLAVKLRQKRFDTLAYLMPRVRSFAQIERDERFFHLAGIEKILGTDYLRQNRLEEAIPIPTPSVESEADYLLHCLSHDGLIPNEIFRTDLLLTVEEISRAKSWFTEAAGAVANGSILVAVAPGSKWESKIWPEGRFAAVVERLVSDFRILPVVFGGGEDRETGDRLLTRWKTGINSAGRLSVRESAALLQQCDLYLGNDTGTMHLAAAVGTPCVAVFAAIDWVGKWTPFGDKNQVFRKRVECEGCHSSICHNNHKCLDLITIDEVYAACVDILSK